MIPTFHTQRLILKAPTEADIPAYERHIMNYEIVRHFNVIVPWPFPAGDIENYVKNEIIAKQGQDDWVWGIFLNENPDELIGIVHLWRPGEPENRGFWLSQHHWGKGYMTEAVKPIMDYAFDHLGFDKLVFSNATQNARSSRVKDNTGAMFVRTEPAKYIDPELTERTVYELTKSNWQIFKKEHHG
ncbi:MAG: GNAT family N-acetyltransferase [Alphaproteobacteria bacterium]